MTVHGMAPLLLKEIHPQELSVQLASSKEKRWEINSGNRFAGLWNIKLTW